MKRPRTSLIQKALLAVTLILLPILISFLYTYSKDKELLKETALKNLTVIAETFETQVYQFTEMTKMRANDFSSDGFIREQLQKIIRGDESAVSGLNAHLVKNKLPLDKNIDQILILSMKERVAASTNSSSIGQDVSNDFFPLTEKADWNIIGETAVTAKSPALAVSSLITNKDTGKPIGILVNLIPISAFNQVMKGGVSKEYGSHSQGIKGHFKTMEAYLVNQDRLMVTESLFVKDAILRQKADTLPVRKCINENKEFAGFYKGYKGIEVAGASMCLPKLKWTLLTEIDSDEILTPVWKMRRNAIITISTVVALVFMLFVLFFRGVILPLRRASRSAEAIANGEYGIALPVETKDEIGMLSTSFNTMAYHVKSRTDSLKDSEKRLMAMLEIQQKYEELVNNLPIGIYRRMADGRLLEVNPAALSVLDLDSKDDFAKHNVSEFYKDKEKFQEISDKLAKQGFIKNEEAEFVSAKGRQFWCSFSGAIKKDKDGNPYFDGVFFDITERKKAEEARIEAQQKYEELINNLPVGVYRRMLDGRIVEVNPAVVAMFDAVSKDELIRHNALSLYRNKNRAKEVSEKMLRQGLLKGEEVEVLTIKGRPITCSFTAITKRDKQGNAYIDGIIEDITEKRMLETQLRHSQKMEAIGQLAGGIAHDFNNILTAIIGYGNLLLRKKPDDEMIKDFVGEMLGAANRAANLTKDLLSFSRKHVIATQPFDLNELVKKNEKILARVIGEHIEIKAAIADKNLVVKIDPAHIEQAFLNLATNARDAMPQGGRLLITTDMATIDNSFIIAHGYGKVGRYAILTFADTGVGMSREVQSRLFEPFFTTKEVGKGTGLGLSTVYGIVKQHGGYVNVYSEPGHGTAFKIYLPMAEGAMPVEEKALPDIIASRGNMETILIAEDDLETRKITKAVLEEYNYKVIEAENGDDAVNKFTASKHEIRLVILDIIMPKKGGLEAYKEIRKIKPGAKVIFLSGYTGDTIKMEDINREGLILISKPVSPNELSIKIKEALGK